MAVMSREGGANAECGRVTLLSSLLIVWALFLSVSLVRAPIPAVNEPHYLAKAKSWWDPAWCEGDFFLASSNPHAVFYATCGWMTRLLSLPATALALRIVGLGMLAWGWTRLTARLFASKASGAAAAALFALMTAWDSFSGEWLIGGIESKVFAYALALWSGALLLDRRPVLSAVLLAGSVAFHPVAGVWVAIAAGIVALGRSMRDGWRRPPDIRRWVVAAAVAAFGIALALAPALPLVVGVDPELAREADLLALTQRVGHHTDPLLFPVDAYAYYGLMLCAWFVLQWRSPGSDNLRRVQCFVAASLVIAGVGLVVGWLPRIGVLERTDPLRVFLLKFYPFRLADLALPMGAALQVAAWMESGPCAASDLAPPVSGRPAGAWPRCASMVIAAAGWIGALLLPAPDANPSGMSMHDRADWIDVCRWLRVETPPASLIATANEDWAVKWYAERPEYVNFKDCPQDAAGIVEWWRRRNTLVEWSRGAKADGSISDMDLARLHDATGVDYLIVSRFGPFDVTPAFERGKFQVYRVAADE